jgi:hypothetical protein
MEKLLLSVEAPKELAAGSYDLVVTVREKDGAQTRVSVPVVVR